MTVQVALLRAVNVAGHNKVPMSALRNLLEEMGFTDVRSVIQSGNLVFRSNEATGAALEQDLEVEAARRLSLRTEFMVRSAAEWAGIIASNPFPAEADSNPGRLLVTFLKHAPMEASVEALRAAISGPEIIHAEGRHLYAVYPEGVGRSRLTNTLVEARLGTRGTARNWNTVLKLAAMAGK